MLEKIKSNKNMILCEALSLAALLLGFSVYFLSAKNCFDIPLIRNFLPDFLWMVSFMLALVPLLKEVFKKHAIFISATICFLLSAVFELFQFLGILSGTGDILDVAVYFAADVISCMIIKNIYVRRKPT